MSKIKGSFCERTLNRKSVFDRRSFRWTNRGKNWILIGCPKKQWSHKSSRCKVGTRGHKLLVASKKRCRIGKRVIKGSRS